MKTPKLMHPITGKDLVQFRNLICGKPSDQTTPNRDQGGAFKSGTTGSETAKRSELANLLGVDPVTIWRQENGGKISHGILMRRSCVQLCDERGIKIPDALRYGQATRTITKAKARGTTQARGKVKTKAKAKAAGAR